ncbi:MAG: sugar ABC transporter permease [Chloroflexota bacterium]|nr:sugar ABC transporter permease [Chloroflexota bacterium]
MHSVGSAGYLSSPSTTRAGRLRMWLGGSYFPYVFVAPFFILFAVFGLYPLLYALRLSFTYWHGSGTPRFIGFSNYTFLLTDGLFWQSMANSAILWLLIVPVQTIFAVLAAVALSGQALRFRWFFRTAFLTPFVVPLVAVAQIWLIFFDQSSGPVDAVLQAVHLPAVGWLTDATWAKLTIALLVLWKSSGFAILIMLAALQAISQEIYEAAAIDGATARVQFWRITLPLLRRTISFYVIVSTLGVIQMFAEPYVLTQGGPYNSTTTAGYRLLSYINNADFGTGAANSFLLMIVVIAIAMFMLRVLRTEEV